MLPVFNQFILDNLYCDATVNHTAMVPSTEAAAYYAYMMWMDGRTHSNIVGDSDIRFMEALNAFSLFDPVTESSHPQCDGFGPFTWTI